MRIIYYTEHTEEDKRSIGRLIRANHAVVVRSSFSGVEPCDAVVTASDGVATAYREEGIDVLSDEDSEIPGPQRVLDDKIYEFLVDAGFDTATKITDASDEELLEISGIGPVSLREIRQIYR